MQLETYFPYRLALAAEAFSQKLVEVYGRKYGLSREEWRLLLLLAEAQQLSSHELAQRTTLDKVQISRASKRLEDKNLITREISQVDKRLRVYACTQTGQALFAEVFPQVDAQANVVLAKLSEEDRAALVQGIEALARAVANNQS
ncbi:DNA-binding MarR family transcriptional regulator [Litoreibacter meonggei]|uniref:DNA-binding MarR family transcriptional regulator n=1 Tax=Litoreibacter meonggei TaxID=1049199 RepID=A0A497W6I3_9RHOB|nr:MarR family transcriptional regulator [Litoreibacter meonggei]RLJ51981.1 DNA-binding MarR family transcriptional regulator [Litoreibacter meonggei]